jgi:O-antigen/teichoic acid export membrane protein
MGKIQNQSIRGFIYTYIGVIIGFISTGYLMPKYLQQNEIGLLRVLVSYASILAQFASLGFSVVAMRLFPYFRNPITKDHGFFGLFVFISGVGLLVSLIGFQLYYYFQLKSDISDLFQQYYLWIIPLTFFILLFIITDSYQRALYNAVKGAIVKEFIQRLLILLAIILFIYNILTLDGLVAGYLIAFIFPPLILLVSLLKNNDISLKPDFKFIDKSLRNRIWNISIFGIISSFSGILVLNIDILMIERYLDLSATGIYAIAFFFGTMVLLPSRPLLRISAIVLADAFKNKDLNTIGIIYKKSSINLTIIGVLILLGIVINMDNIFMLIGEEYKAGYYVIILVAASNLIQMSAGVLNQLIFYSDYYRFSAYFILIFAVMLVLSNIIFIPLYGITGAAIASISSNFIYIFGRIVFVYAKLRLNPYQLKTFFPIVFAFVIFFIQTLLPVFNNLITDILVRSMLVSMLFGFAIYFFKVSPDINHWIKNKLQRLISK